MKKPLFVMVILSFLVGGCDSENAVPDIPIPDDATYSMITDFYRLTHPESRTSYIMPVITDIDTKYYIAEGDTVMETLPSRASDNIFEISTVTMQIEGEKGYAVLSKDERINEIFFFSESGCMGDTANIPPLKQYIEEIPYHAADKLNTEVATTRSDIISEEDFGYSFLVPFKWGQYKPFNRYTPPCNAGNCDGHFPVGCVTTAVAQVIATINKFDGTFYGNRSINFSQLKALYYEMDETESKSVAQFFHEVSLCVQTKFGCGGSYTTLKAAYNYLKDLEYDCEYIEGKTNTNKLYSLINQGIPQILAGTSDVGSHAWVVDGAFLRVNALYFHCNWGLDGDSNAWVSELPYSYIKDGKEHTYTNNLCTIYINSK